MVKPKGTKWLPISGPEYQHRTSDELSTAHKCSGPRVICSNVVMFRSSIGIGDLRPQHSIVRFVVIPHVVLWPAETSMYVLSFSLPNWSRSFRPQQRILFSCVMPQECMKFPTLIVLNLWYLGGLLWPTLFLPQHSTYPLSRRPQLLPDPQETCTP